MFILLRDTVSLACGIQVSLLASRAVFYRCIATSATLILFMISFIKIIHDESNPHWRISLNQDLFSFNVRKRINQKVVGRTQAVLPFPNGILHA